MSRFEGKFTNTKNEKLDEFYTAIGKLISYLKVVLCCYYRNLFFYRNSVGSTENDDCFITNN